MRTQAIQTPQISLHSAAKLTAAHRRQFPGVTRAFFFGRNSVESLLDENGASGLRSYFGIDENQGMHLVLTSVTDPSAIGVNGSVMQRLIPCPPWCPDTNMLSAGVRVKAFKKTRQKDTVFTGFEDHSFTLEQGIELCSRFEESFPSRTKSNYFDAEGLREALAQEGCVGIRFYSALTEDGENILIASPANREMNDIAVDQLQRSLAQNVSLCSRVAVAK